MAINTKPIWPGGMSHWDIHQKYRVWWAYNDHTVRPLYIAFRVRGVLDSIYRVSQVEHSVPISDRDCRMADGTTQMGKKIRMNLPRSGISGYRSNARSGSHRGGAGTTRMCGGRRDVRGGSDERANDHGRIGPNCSRRIRDEMSKRKELVFRVDRVQCIQSRAVVMSLSRWTSRGNLACLATATVIYLIWSHHGGA